MFSKEGKFQHLPPLLSLFVGVGVEGVILQSERCAEEQKFNLELKKHL